MSPTQAAPTVPETIDEHWMTLAEAAEYIGVQRHIITRLWQRGDLRSSRTPFDRRLRLFYVEDLNALSLEPADTFAS